MKKDFGGERNLILMEIEKSDYCHDRLYLRPLPDLVCRLLDNMAPAKNSFPATKMKI